MQLYTKCPTRTMVYAQMLVKRYDGRFIGHRLQQSSDQWFTLSFEDIHKVNQFNVMMNIIRQPYF